MNNAQQRFSTSDMEEHIFLIGRPPLAEFLGFVSSQTSPGMLPEQRELIDEWRLANAHIAQLEANEPDWRSDLVVAPIPARLVHLKQAAMNDPMFQRSFNSFPVELGMVELDRLVVFQKQINLVRGHGRW